MHIKPKKGLGQNFLTDKNMQNKAVEACQFSGSDIVLEIGAGRGEMTRLIAGRVKKIFALEIDKRLCVQLKKNLEDFRNAEIINQDVLKFNISEYFKDCRQKLKVFGNIPYYISSPIIERLLSAKDRIDTIFITVQKEFALRMSAPSPSRDFSSLSCFVQYHAQPKIILNIKKDCFAPKPKVDSCLVRLKVYERPGVLVKNENLFFKIIRSAFAQRRKTLKNSLKGVVNEKDLERFFHDAGIRTDIRPESLSLQDFASLSNTASSGEVSS